MTSPSSTVQNQTDQNLLIEIECKPYLDEIEKKIQEVIRDFFDNPSLSQTYLSKWSTPLFIGMKLVFIDSYKKQLNSTPDRTKVLERLKVENIQIIEAIALNLSDEICDNCLEKKLIARF